MLLHLMSLYEVHLHIMYTCLMLFVLFFCTGPLLEPNSRHLVLQMFAAMIQSGKDVFIDQNTKLKVYTFSRPNIVGVHTHF